MRSSLWVELMRWMSSLSSGFPGTMAKSPESPAPKAASRWSYRVPPLCFSGP
jgi:hypothetical protein